MLEIVLDVASRLEKAGVEYAIGGSLASSTWGQMRQTNDADIAVKLGMDQADLFLAHFHAPYLISQSDLVNALNQNDEFRSVQLLHVDEAFKIDLFLLTDSEYDNTEIRRVRIVPIDGTRSLRFCSAEDIVIAKLRWFALGNRVSDRQWNDIVQVFNIQDRQLDYSYLRRWCNHFAVLDLLEEARSQN